MPQLVRPLAKELVPGFFIADHDQVELCLAGNDEGDILKLNLKKPSKVVVSEYCDGKLMGKSAFRNFKAIARPPGHEEPGMLINSW